MHETKQILLTWAWTIGGPCQEPVAPASWPVAIPHPWDARGDFGAGCPIPHVGPLGEGLMLYVLHISLIHIILSLKCYHFNRLHMM